MSNSDALSLTKVLEENTLLSHLRQRLDDSQKRFDVIRPLLPEGCVSDVRHCSADEHHWTLWVSSPAIAAKLRQWIPELERALAERGWGGQAVRVKVQS